MICILIPDTVQANFRGRASRKSVKEMKEKAAELAEQTKAATLMQAQFRRKSAVKTVEMKREQKEKDTELKKLFDEVDIDDSGALDLSELEILMARMQEPLSEEVNQLFDKYACDSTYLSRLSVALCLASGFCLTGTKTAIGAL